MIGNENNMDYSNITTKTIEDALTDVFNRLPDEPPRRHIKMYTNAYGVDTFEEALENTLYPCYRIYYGKKVARWIKNNTRLHKSRYTKRYYKLIKGKHE